MKEIEKGEAHGNILFLRNGNLDRGGNELGRHWTPGYLTRHLARHPRRRGDCPGGGSMNALAGGADALLAVIMHQTREDRRRQGWIDDRRGVAVFVVGAFFLGNVHVGCCLGAGDGSGVRDGKVCRVCCDDTCYREGSCPGSSLSVNILFIVTSDCLKEA